MRGQTYARIAGALFLISMVAGLFGELYAPSHIIVSGDAAATALLAAFFGLVSTAVFAGAELFYFGASLIVGGAGYLKSFSADQLNSLGLLSLKMYGLGGGIFMAFYGVATLIRGYLIYRSGFLPRALGALMALAGIGFIASNFLLVLAPAYTSDFLLLPMFLTVVSVGGWLLLKGVDVSKWEASAAI